MDNSKYLSSPNSILNLSMNSNQGKTQTSQLVIPQGTNVIDYIVQRLTFRVGLIRKSKMALNSIFSIEEFIVSKKDMAKLFDEIEEDINQGVESIRTLLKVNQDLQEEYQRIQSKLSSNQIRVESYKKKCEDLSNVIIEQTDMIKQLNQNCIKKNLTLQEYERMLCNLNEEKKALTNYNQRILIINDELEKNNILLGKEVDYAKNQLHSQICNNYKSNEISFGHQHKQSSKGSVATLEEMEEYNPTSKQPVISNISNHPSSNTYIASEDNPLFYSSDEMKENPFKKVIEDKKAKQMIIETTFRSPGSPSDLNEEKIDYDLENLISERKSKILININSDPNKIDLLNNTYGNDFLRRLLDKGCSLEFLDNIDQTLTNYQNEKASNILVNSNSEYKKGSYSFNEDILDSPKPIAQPSSATGLYNIREADVEEELIRKSPKLHSLDHDKRKFQQENSKCKMKHTSKSCRAFKNMKPIIKGGANFEKCLRDYSKGDSKEKSRSNSKVNESTHSHQGKKVFINYNSQYGRFFDRGIVYNGVSDLDKKEVFENKSKKYLMTKENIKNSINMQDNDLVNSRFRVDNTSNIKIEDETENEIN